MTGIDDVRAELAAAGDPAKAAGLARYLQVFPGGYGAGDEVLGVPVPVKRRIASRFWTALLPATFARIREGEFVPTCGWPRGCCTIRTI